MSAAFLEAIEVCELTGRKTKSRQIDYLRQMGLPFFVNATGHPVVPRSVVDGKKDEPVQQKWIPKVLRGR